MAIDNTQPGRNLFPLVVLGALVVTSVAAYRFRPAPKPSSARRRDALISYLHDHLGGADLAIQVVRRLAHSHQGTEDGRLFAHLDRELTDDRAVLRELLAQMGADRASMKGVAGVASGSALGLVVGGEPGDLSLWRVLEGLSIGVQGKRCLWRALQHLDVAPWTLGRRQFENLEARALRQWEAIEERRRALVLPTFITPS